MFSIKIPNTVVVVVLFWTRNDAGARKVVHGSARLSQQIEPDVLGLIFLERLRRSVLVSRLINSSPVTNLKRGWN